MGVIFQENTRPTVVDKWCWENNTGSCCWWAGLGWQFSDGGFSDAVFLNSHSVRMPKGIIRMLYFNSVILSLQGFCAFCKSQNDKARAKRGMKWNFKNVDLQEMLWPHQSRGVRTTPSYFRVFRFTAKLRFWLSFQFQWKLNAKLLDFLIAGDISAVALHFFVNWSYSPIFSNLHIGVHPISAGHF